MRVGSLVKFLPVAVLVPTLGSAQILYRPTPPPLANAAAAQWQVQGEPLLHAGMVYLPTGPSVFFDGNRMVRVGEYLGVPLYADTTLEPFSVVYVPVAGGLMKPYERPRTGDLSGTVGSRTPALPVPPAGAGADLRWPAVPAQASAPPRPVPAPPAPAIVVEAAEGGNRTAGTSGTAGSLASQAAGAPVQSRVETIPPAATNEGMWVEYEGRRWYSAGPAVAFSPDRFTPVGDHHGFPVYRERSGAPEMIYVTVVAGGPLAPYAAR